MTKQPRQLASAIAAVVLAAGMLSAFSAFSFADDAPRPDPSGTATGDKSSAVDGAGNPFVVPEPTDKTSPDYAKNKKDFRRLSGPGSERSRWR